MTWASADLRSRGLLLIALHHGSPYCPLWAAIHNYPWPTFRGSDPQGLAGYINQVIKTGTYPGFASSDLGIGTSAFYHKANVEAGGATPNRLFSYYVGLGGANQDHRFYDQFNGASVTPAWGATTYLSCSSAVNPTPATVASCYDNGTFEPNWQILAPYQIANYPTYYDRETVVNFHFGIPHHHDGGRDDVQLLYQTSTIDTWEASSAQDFGSAFDKAVYGTDQFCYFGGVATATNCLGVVDGLPAGTAIAYQYNGQLGQTFASSAGLAAMQGETIPYAFPNAGTAGNGGYIPTGLRDGEVNDIGIVKVQYQKNFSSNAYLRVYGYSLYSDWMNSAQNTFTTGIFSPPYDYELESHTRGVSMTFADQLTPKNLLQLQGSYLTAFSLRDNNTQMLNGVSSGYDANVAAVVVSAANPENGICYDSTGTAVNCSYRIAHLSGNPTPERVTLGNLYSGSVPALPGSCGGAACEWLVVGNGQRATYNNVKPNFGSASLTDEWEPTDRLHINLGVRYDSFQFVPQNTDTGMRNFWFNAWNASECYNTANRIAGVDPLTTPVTGGTAAVNAACVAQYGPGFAQATLSPVSFTQTFTVWQPRAGLTYTLDPLNVLRLTWGKYDQAPNTAFEQYNTLQQNLPSIFAQGTLGGFNLFGYGRNAPTFPIRPELSYNTDFSWEHQFKGTDLSFKFTPFYRRTQDQVEQFFLDLATGFVSGLNVGTQTSDGVEFQLQKGDFSRNGFSALLSYTYTNAYIKYLNLNGGPNSLLDPTNQAIAQYNAYTSACAANPSARGCTYKGVAPTDPATGAPIVAAPCYTTSGAPVAAASCTPADIANPYWNDSPKAFLDPNGTYPPYDLFLGPPGYGSYGSFVAPHVATIVLNYRHDKWAITPALQFSGGEKYGYPLTETGIDPGAGCGSLGVAPNTTRNPFTYTGGGSAYDGTSGCAFLLANPDPATNQFDPMGSFTEPNRWTLNTQLTYDVSPRIQVVATFANILDVCQGGTQMPWTKNIVDIPNASKVCSYAAGPGYSSGLAPTGNNYNPGNTIQPMYSQPYQPLFGSLPFNAFIDFKLKL
jgi:hypothetical protein